ncbi:MAG: PIN domain-containing protein [Patescibacteria group bacterium]
MTTTPKRSPRLASPIIIVDTNIVIRYLTGDDMVKAEKFRTYLRKNRNLFVSDTVLAEIYFVLTKYYEFSRQKVLSWLTDLICHPNIRCNESLLKETIKIVSEYNVSFVDGFAAALALDQADGRLLTYDLALGKIAGIKRIEP